MSVFPWFSWLNKEEYYESALKDYADSTTQTDRRIKEAEHKQCVLPLGRERRYEHLPLVYVAGKFRAARWWDIEQNIREAEGVGMALWDNGVPAIIPHTNGRFYHGVGSEEVFLCGNLKMMSVCDAVVVCGWDWQSSEGTSGEVAEAQRIGLPVFFWRWKNQVAEFSKWLEDGWNIKVQL